MHAVQTIPNTSLNYVQSFAIAYNRYNQCYKLEVLAERTWFERAMLDNRCIHAFICLQVVATLLNISMRT